MRLLSIPGCTYPPGRCKQRHMPHHQLGKGFAIKPATRGHIPHAEPQGLDVPPNISHGAGYIAAGLSKAGILAGVEPALTQRLVQSMTRRDVATGQQLVSAGAAPTAVWLVPQESCSGQPGEPLMLLGWQEALTQQPAAATIAAVSPTTALAMTPAAFLQLLREAPALQHHLVMAAAANFGRAQAMLQERSNALMPWLVPAPSTGIVGNSALAKRLKKSILAAAQDPGRRPVLLVGEPGLQKRSLAALVHYASTEQHKHPVVALDAPSLGKDCGALLGRGGHPGLLEWLGEGTLILCGAQQAKPELIVLLGNLLRGQTLRSGQPCLARFVFTAEASMEWLAELCTVIKVPPLRVRPMDVPALQQRFLKRAARRRGQPLEMTPAAVRRLEGHSFYGNITELEATLERAVAQASPGATELTEDMFWFAGPTPAKTQRTNLLALPWLRAALRSEWWPEKLNMVVIAPAYALTLAVLLLGPQTRHDNVALTVFWGWWWAGSFLVFPLLGRIWCSVCPFMIYGEIVQRWRLAQGAVLRKWPRAQVERWGPWFLVSLFAGILVWEEVWHLPDNAALSAWLLLLITAGAVGCSWVFERRLWCRFLCPIGGMNGMFAKLAATEVRASRGVCAGNCSTYTCFKGGPAEPPEGLATAGCPLHSHPAQLANNKDCTLCMVCVKACPHQSVGLYLRPLGADLRSGQAGTASELSLMFLLLGAVGAHCAPTILEQVGADPLLVTRQGSHLATTAALLAGPGLAVWAMDVATRRLLKTAPAPFLKLAYSYMPLVWAFSLAYWLGLLLSEGGTLLPATARTVGLGGVASWLPSAQAEPHVASFVRHTVLLGGLVPSLVLLRRLGMATWANLVPHAAAMSAFTAEMWWLIP